ncbi:hypothetical protein [Tolypothrix sp. VBCCA 56010]
MQNHRFLIRRSRSAIALFGSNHNNRMSRILVAWRDFLVMASLCS